MSRKGSFQSASPCGAADILIRTFNWFLHSDFNLVTHFYFSFLADLPGMHLFVDGLVARTFTPEDANNYFMLLLKTPPSQYILQYYGIVYYQGAWYITNDGNLVQGISPGVPLQPTPLLDYSTTATHGTVVPQRRWTPADEVDVRRFVENAVLQLPIFFVNRNGGLGFRLLDILRGCSRDLYNANNFAPLGGRHTTYLRINVSLFLTFYSR